MIKVVLIFLSTMLILLLGLFFGFEQIQKSFEIPAHIAELSIPFEKELNKEFIENLKPAL